jgi:Protein of unknown function (DUF2510)
MTTPDQPGWYDDPQNSNAQRYWDGQNWTPHRQRKNTTPTTRDPGSVAPPPPLPQMPPPPLPPPPAARMTPPHQLGPYIDKVRPHVAKGQQLWSGLSQQGKIAFAAAGLVAVVIVFAFGAHLFGSGGAGSGSADGASGSTAAVDTSSQSYQMGLKSGTDGPAEMAAFGYDAISDQPGQLLQKVGPVSHQEACEQGFNSDNSPFSRPDNGLNKTDYMAGCLYGLDHNANSKPTAPRTVVPPSHR